MEQGTDVKQPQSGIQRVISIFTAPTTAVEAIKEKPNYLVPMVIIWVIGIAYTLLTRDLTMQAMDAAYASTGLSADQIAATKEQMSGLTTVSLYVGMLIMPLLPMFKGAVSHLLSILFSGKGSFGSTVSLVLNAYIIQMIGTAIALPIVLLTQNIGFSFSPAIILSADKIGTPIFSTLSAFNVFTIWYLAVTVIGIKKIHEVSTWKAAVIALFPFILFIGVSWIGVAFGGPSGL